MNDFTVQGRCGGRMLILFAVGLVFLVTGLLAGNWMLSRSHELRAAQMFPQPRDLIEFELRTGAGEPFGREALEGQWSLMFFGFTNCPDICPDTMALLASAMEDMSHMGRDTLPQVVFVSVDPERDQGQDLDDYVRWFNPDFKGVTGDHEELGRLTRYLGLIYYREAADPESGFYSVDHSSSVLVIDPEGRVVARFPPPLNAEDVVADLFRLTG